VSQDPRFALPRPDEGSSGPTRTARRTGTAAAANSWPGELMGAPVAQRDPVAPRQGTARAAGQDRLAEVARGGTLNLAGAVVAAAATVGVTVLVTRQFSRPVAGAFFTATSAFLIAEAVASLGANTGLVYFIARLRSLNEGRRIPAILRAATIPVLVASALATSAMFLLAGPLAHFLVSGHLGHGTVSPAEVAVALRALALTLPFAALLDTFLGATRGYRDMRPTVLIDKTSRSAAQLAGVLVAVVAGSATLLAPLWALPYVPAAALAWLWLRRIRRNPPRRRLDIPDVPPELAALMALSTPVEPRKTAPGHRIGKRMAAKQLGNANPRGFWRFTIPRAVASLASIILQRLDIVLVAIMKGPTEAAVYTAATRFLVAGQFGNMAISMAAQPRFTELFAVGDRRGANEIYQVTTAWLVLLTWPLYLLVIVYGPQVLAIFGHSYRAGDTVMVVLSLTMLFASACGQVDMVLITTGRSTWSLFNGLLAVSVDVAVDLLLIPRYGILGAAIGWSAAIVVSNLIPLIQLMATIRLHPFGRGTIAAGAVSAVSFCAIPLAAHVVLGGGAVALAAGAAAGCLVLAASLWWLRSALHLSAMPGVAQIKARRRH
jgi:O-antigen/teichoic acid export membrane protein